MVYFIGYIDGPLKSAGRKIHKALCIRPLLKACDYFKCAANAHCTNGGVVNEEFSCTCNVGFTGDGKVTHPFLNMRFIMLSTLKYC